MDVVLNVAFPFFALIFGGYGAARFEALAPAAVIGLNSFVFWFALPAMLFMKMSAAPVGEVFDWRFLAAFSGGGMLAFIATYAAGRALFSPRPAESAIQGMAAAFGNIGYMGIPIIVAVFGDKAVLPAALVLVADHVVTIPVTTALIEYDRPQHGSLFSIFWRVLGNLARHPLILSIAAGLASAALHVRLPVPLAALGDLLAGAAPPCALFALGATLAGRPLTQGWREVGLMSAGKLFVHPLMAYAIARALALDPFLTAVVVVEASLPIAANVFIMARAYDTYVERASSAILVSTIVAVFTVSGLLAVLAPS
jgi:predicted permease